MFKSPVFLAVIVLMTALVAIGYQTVALNKVRQKKIQVVEQPAEARKAEANGEKLPAFNELAKQNLMGVVVKKGGDKTAADKAAKADAIKFILMGTIISSGGSKKSSAFIQGSNHETRRYYVGDTLEASVVLESVAADSVVLKRNGRSETLHYPENVSAPAPPAPPAPQAAPAQPAPANPPGIKPGMKPGLGSAGPAGNGPAGRLMDLRSRLRNAQPGQPAGSQ